MKDCGKGNGSLPLRPSLHFLAAENQETSIQMTKIKTAGKEPGVVAHTFNSSAQGAEEEGFL